MAQLDLNVDVNVEGQSKLSGLGKSLGNAGMQVAKFAAGAGVAAVGAAAGLTALAAEAEKSSALLEASFKNMGKTSGKTLEQLKQQATELGEATTFDDEGIMEAQAALLSFGAVSGDAFDRTIEGAADLAAATGTDLTAATKSLGKALADPAKGLTKLARAGVVFTDQQKEQVAALVEAGDTLGAQDVILDAVEKRYKGVNETLSNTAAGDAAQALEDLQNAGEDLGSIFLPILAGLAQGVSAFAHFVQDNMGTIRPIIETIGQVFQNVFGFIANTIIPAVIGAFSGLGTSTGGIATVVDFFAKNVLPFLVSAFQQVVAFITENWPTISSVFSQVFGAVANVVKVVGPIILSIAKVVFPAVLTAAGVLLTGLDRVFKLIGGIFEVAGTVVETVVDSIMAAWELLSRFTKGIWEGIGTIIKGAINVVIGILNGFFGFLNGLAIPIPSISIPNPFGGGPLVQAGGGTIDPFNIPLIPQLAAGGIITSPTLALLGESGAEAVVPLDRAGGVGTNLNVTVMGDPPFLRNPDDLVRLEKRLNFLEGFGS